MKSQQTQSPYRFTKSLAAAGEPTPSSASKQETSSGTPSLLPYPNLLDWPVPEFKDTLAYIIEPYKEDGFSVLFWLDGDLVATRIGDWDGNPIDLANLQDDETGRAITRFMKEWFVSISHLLELIHVQQCQLYFSVDGDDVRLVDLRRSLNLFSGPGMVRDLFHKIIPVQEVRKVTPLDDDALAAIEARSGTYEKDFFLKASSFGTVVRDREMLPLYARVQK